MHYEGSPVAVKEFNNLSTAEAVRHETLMMSKCVHLSLPHFFGMNLLLIVIVTLYVSISHGHVSLFPVPFFIGHCDASCCKPPAQFILYMYLRHFYANLALM